MKHVKHWQDAVNALLGAWLVASPWVLGFQSVLVAAAVTTAIGALLVASSVEAMQVPQAWEEWLDVMLGVGLMLAPVLFGFGGVAPALQNALITGGVVTVLALWVLATDDEFAANWEEPIR
ncbi:SPW repeat protein [Ramlibacter sp. PS3R-8]|uniref:SPW repeat protein n=1 Tax=Ramlibacter sp. PS3R-8 TaxID=3133437 RepID=UPI0030995918